MQIPLLETHWIKKYLIVIQITQMNKLIIYPLYLYRVYTGLRRKIPKSTQGLQEFIRTKKNFYIYGIIIWGTQFYDLQLMGNLIQENYFQQVLYYN